MTSFKLKPLHPLRGALSRIFALTLATSITGCAFSPWNSFKSPTTQTQENLAQTIKDPRQNTFQAGIVTETDAPIPLAVAEIESNDDRDSVTLSATQTSFFGVIKGLASRKGYAVAVADGVDINKRMSIQINGQPTVRAIRQIAGLAGYVAVFNHNDRTITIAQTATYTFKLPDDLFKRRDAKYNIGGDPTSNSTGGSSGGSGGGAPGGSGSSSSPIKARFEIDGTTAATATSPIATGLMNILKSMAGPGAQVDLSPESGLIIVRANSQGLKRVYDYLQSYVQDQMRQVEVTAAIVEVGVSDQFQYGIKWDKVLNAAGTKSFNYDMTGVGTAIAGVSPASLNITTASISSVIQALEQFTRTRVVSQPSLLVINHTPATIFNGDQIPYLPSITNTMSGTTGTTQASATGAYALQGISLSVVPDIMDNSLVQLSLTPVTSSVGKFTTFSLGDKQGSIQMPNTTVKQSTMKVMTESDRTVILGGARSNRAADQNTGLPWLIKIPLLGALAGGTDYVDTVVESVVMVHTRILPAPRFDTLVAEAL